MKSQFPQYYRVSRQDLLDNFNDCYFLFDACVLLDIFRLKEELVDKIFNVINHYKDKIRIPYHAASEYFKNINVVLEQQVSKIKESRKSFDAFSKTFQAQRNYPYISDKASNLLARLEKQIDKDFKNQIQYLDTQLVYGEHQNKLSSMLDGNVLAPFTNDEIINIEKEGEQRYQKQIPPGWKDAPKDDNRYGDLINWKEILRFAKESGKSIIFVSNDVKDDWVTKVMGKRLGVLPQLLEEFYLYVGNPKQYFHVYTLDRFLAFINEHDRTIVSEETVKDVQVSMENSFTPKTVFEITQFVNERLKGPEYILKLKKLSETYNKLTSLNGSQWYEDFMLNELGKSENKNDALKLSCTDNNDMTEKKQESDIGINKEYEEFKASFQKADTMKGYTDKDKI